MKNERDKRVVDLDPDEIYTERKKENEYYEQLSFGRIARREIFLFLSICQNCINRIFQTTTFNSECKTDNLLLTYM